MQEVDSFSGLFIVVDICYVDEVEAPTQFVDLQKDAPLAKMQHAL